MKILVVVILLAILGSLGSGLLFLVRDGGQADSRRVVRALTVRISLSIALFVVLLLAWRAGIIQPHGVRP